MGLAALGALFFIFLALIGQSPRLMRRLGLDVYRLDLRIRAFTGYAFACLLLVAGFFVAGVPLGEANGEPMAQMEGTPTPGTIEAEAGTPGSENGALPGVDSGEMMTDTVGSDDLTPTDNRPASGAFGGVPTRTTPTPEPGEATQESGVVVTPDIPTPTSEGDEPQDGTAAATTAAETPSPTATGTPTPVSTDTPTPTPTDTPTSTPTSTPTMTPTPTLTPTPIIGETAVLDTDGANVWLYRSPGGQQLRLVSHGETVILGSGHANQAGVLWREVQTLDGTVGWVRAAYVTEE